jgi:hypothetical protein
VSEWKDVPRRLAYGRGPEHDIETASGAPGYTERDLTPDEVAEAVRTYKALRGMYLLITKRATGLPLGPVERQDVAEMLRSTWFSGEDVHDGITAALDVLQRKLNAHEYTGEQEAYLGIRVEKAPDEILFSRAIAAELHRRAKRVNFPEGFGSGDNGC